MGNIVVSSGESGPWVEKLSLSELVPGWINVADSSRENSGSDLNQESRLDRDENGSRKRAGVRINQGESGEYRKKRGQEDRKGHVRTQNKHHHGSGEAEGRDEVEERVTKRPNVGDVCWNDRPDVDINIHWFGCFQTRQTH